MDDLQHFIFDDVESKGWPGGAAMALPWWVCHFKSCHDLYIYESMTNTPQATHLRSLSSRLQCLLGRLNSKRPIDHSNMILIPAINGPLRTQDLFGMLASTDQILRTSGILIQSPHSDPNTCRRNCSSCHHFGIHTYTHKCMYILKSMYSHTRNIYIYVHVIEITCGYHIIIDHTRYALRDTQSQNSHYYNNYP